MLPYHDIYFHDFMEVYWCNKYLQEGEAQMSQKKLW